jgi:hypothetical protein
VTEKSNQIDCPECGVSTVVVGGNAIRCVGCGAILEGASALPTGLPPQVSLDIRYDCPVSRTDIRFLKDQFWAVSVQFHEDDVEYFLRLIKNLTAAIKSINHASLAPFHSFHEADQRIVFKLPKDEQLVPLSHIERPIDVKRVRRLLENLQDPLEALHEQGLATVDLSAEMLFVPPDFTRVVLVPSPWMISLLNRVVVAGDAVPFIAPEVASQDAAIDVRRTDVYGLGALAWHLLTDQRPDERAGQLPSECYPSLAHWDRFIDGCGRTNPERRFQTIREACQAWSAEEQSPAHGEQSAVISSKQSNNQISTVRPITVSQPAVRATGKSRNSGFVQRHRKSLIGIAFAVALIFTAMTLLQPAGFGWSTGYKRGYGNTVLRYKDRTYEGSEWERLQEVDSLQSMVDSITISGPGGGIQLTSNVGNGIKGVEGWSDDSFWVFWKTINGAVVFACQNGHWSVATAITQDLDVFLDAHVVSDNEVLFVTYPHAYRLKGTALTTIKRTGQDEWFWWRDNDVGGCFTKVADDHLYYHNGAYGSFTDKSFEVYGRTDKRSYIHSKTNTPMDEYPAGCVHYSASVDKLKSFGLACPPFLSSRNPALMVEYQNGFWYKSAELPDLKSEPAAVWWSGTGGEVDFFVTAGSDREKDANQVRLFEMDGSSVSLRITKTEFPTSMNLIAVWGVDRNRFWVMDDCGTVWQRSGDQWRTDLRGLDINEVQLTHTWISPTGVVIAAGRDRADPWSSKDATIYRLK